MYLKFAWRYFKAKKSTNAINIIAWVTISVIAFATCCQLLVLSVFNGFEDLVKSLYSSFYTDLKIVPARGKTFLLTPAQVASLKGSPAVDELSLIAEEKALLKNFDAQTVIYLKGVDENYSRVSGVASRTTRGTFNTGTPDSPMIIVGAGVQNAVQVNVDPAAPPGDLTVVLPKKNSTGNDPLQSISEGNVKASGIFNIQQEFDEKYAVTNMGFVKQQMGFGTDEYSAVEIKLKEKADAGKEQKRLQALLGSGYLVRTRYEQNATLYNTMKLEKWVIYGVFTLILIIVTCTIVSSLTMLVLEKRRDITVLQSMGARAGTIRKIFLSEGVLLGFVGAAAGIVLAVIICLLQVNFRIVKIEGGSFLIDYFPVKFMAPDFLLVAATAILIAFLAAWFPARKASRQKIELR
jgi:lipoprotein-releasing system permease protein